MSTQGNLALARPLRTATPAQAPAPRRHLEIATRVQRRARPRVAHIVVTIGGIAVILLIQLVLSFVLADGAYYISTLQGDQRDLLRQEQALDERLELLGSTQNLTANAEALGMVESGNPMFLDVVSGAVTGTASATGALPQNMVANSLLDGSTIIDPAALAAARAAEAASGDQGTNTVEGTHTATTTETSTTPGTIPSPATH